MKVEKGKIIIDSDDLMTDEILKTMGKHVVFQRMVFDGIVELLIKDEADWNGEEDSPWYCTCGFGRSYFESSRVKLIASLDKIMETQIKAIQKERDTMEGFYHEYQTKSIDLERQVSDLKYELRMAREERQASAQQHQPVTNGDA